MFDNWSKQSGPPEAPSFSIVTWDKRHYRRTPPPWLEDINSSAHMTRHTLWNKKIAPFLSKSVCFPLSQGRLTC